MPYSKLDWINGQYIQALADEDLVRELLPFVAQLGIEVSPDALLALAPVVNMRLKRLTDIGEQLKFLQSDDDLQLPAEKLVHKKMPAEAALQAFTAAHAFIIDLDAADFTAEGLAAGLRQIGEQYTDNGKAGPFLGTMRFAVTGEKVSPPLFESILALGRVRALARIDAAIGQLRTGTG